MKEFKLNIDLTKEDFQESLGITDEDVLDLENKFNNIVMDTILNKGTLSKVVKDISLLDITPEQYTYVILQLGNLNKMIFTNEQS